MNWITENLPPEVISSPLFRFKVIVPGGLQLEVDISKDVCIDYENLELTLEAVPGQYVFWSSIYSELKYQTSLLEAKISRRRATIMAATLDRSRMSGVRLTDKQVHAFVDADVVDEASIKLRIQAEGLASGKTEEEIAANIKSAIDLEFQQTLPYLEQQLLNLQRNAGKAYHMVQAIQMRSENCRSLAGFKRQDKEQSGHMQ